MESPLNQQILISYLLLNCQLLTHFLIINILILLLFYFLQHFFMFSFNLLISESKTVTFSYILSIFHLYIFCCVIILHILIDTMIGFYGIILRSLHMPLFLSVAF